MQLSSGAEVGMLLVFQCRIMSCLPHKLNTSLMYCVTVPEQHLNRMMSLFAYVANLISSLDIDRLMLAELKVTWSQVHLYSFPLYN